jgi:hypothetical protein
MMYELRELRGMTVMVGDHPIGEVSDLILAPS